jgi:putative phage-type endonuclease
MEFLDIEESAEQGTAEWHKQRLGKLTASRFGDAIDTLKNGTASSKQVGYAYELLSERLTGLSQPFFETADMRWGKGQEAYARLAYQEATGLSVQEVGFIQAPWHHQCGVSPDGLVGDDGLIEIKCPRSTTFLKWVIDGEVPEQHKPQMLLQLVVTERKWCDFVAYDQRMPEPLFIKRFEPRDEEIEKTKQQAIDFLAYVDSLMHKVIKIK